MNNQVRLVEMKADFFHLDSAKELIQCLKKRRVKRMSGTSATVTAPTMFENTPFGTVRTIGVINLGIRKAILAGLVKDWEKTNKPVACKDTFWVNGRLFEAVLTINFADGTATLICTNLIPIEIEEAA